MSSSPPYYTEYQGSLQVLESQMHWTEIKDGSRIYVTGIVTNRSTNAWRDLEFECRFFDGSGAMVDAAHARGSLTINPHDDSAFRVAVTPGTASNQYRTCAVSVSTARNTKGPF